tara:strand:- start:350 stop:835 length:486 start_codon:yes stop_codon:yes gene_type:complete
MFPHKVYNIEYDNALNTRLHKRYFPSQELQPNFDPRPTPTKYTHYQIQDQPLKTKTDLRMYKEYDANKVLNTGNAKGPVQYALNMVDVESTLGNRFMALQKNDHAYYIPPTKSDLYEYPLKTNQTTSEHYTYSPSLVKNVDRLNLAPNTFHNSTRLNLKNL